MTLKAFQRLGAVGQHFPRINNSDVCKVISNINSLLDFNIRKDMMKGLGDERA